MKCYVCGTAFGPDKHGECPGICPRHECWAIQDDPVRWEQFVEAKREFILASIMKAGGTVYVHLNPRRD